MQYYQNEHLPEQNKSFRIKKWPTRIDQLEPASDYEKMLAKEVSKLAKLQDTLYADGHLSVLLIFQAMDAAGKDSTIRHVFSGVNPAGCRVTSFKTPSANELKHDFLWRTTAQLPERGCIGIFNRSYYEEVLVVKVHPEYLDAQMLPNTKDSLWKQRYQSICEFEQHLVRSGTVVLKFFLHVSKQEQARRIANRLEDPDKNWKFNPGDLQERALWDQYQQAYQDMIEHTHQENAPWYVIPADDKPYMRYIVARTIRKTLETCDLHCPTLDEKILAQKDEFLKQLKD